MEKMKLKTKRKISLLLILFLAPAFFLKINELFKFEAKTIVTNRNNTKNIVVPVTMDSDDDFWNFNGTNTVSSVIKADSDDDFWNFLEGGLFLNTWSYRKNITFLNSKITGTGSHINFTVLIDVIDSDLAECTRANGEDIAFYLGSTQLDHEIEFYNKTNGELTAWVRIPSLSTSSDTTISMYYGNNSISNQEDVNNVWSGDYEAVWHLDAYSYDDSTSNSHNGTNYNTHNIDGQIAGGKAFDGDDQFVEYPDSDDLSVGNGAQDFPFTLSTWVKFDEINRNQIIFSKTFSNREFTLSLASNNRLYLIIYGNDSTSPYICLYSSDTLVTGEWYYICGTYSGNSTEEGLSMFLNGQDNSSLRMMSGSYIASKNTGEKFRLGGYKMGANNDLNGILDETRVLSTNRSASWINTEWNNQYSVSTFMNFASQEEAGAYTHNTKLDEVSVRDFGSYGSDLAQMRFQLNIPQGVTITSANLTVWEINDRTTINATIERIDETNVGSLEDDIIIPLTTNINSVEHDFDNSGSEWKVINITDMLQDQLNLGDWVHGNYFGVRFSMNSEDDVTNSFEDYSHINTHHSYINVSYVEEVSKNLIIPIASGVDDDYWQNKSGWTHHTEEIRVRVTYDPTRGREYSNFRWSVPIPQYSTIQYATVNVWEIQESGEYDATVRRINETNVGALESDTEIPDVTDTNLAYHPFNKSASAWGTTVITNMLQDQVKLPEWQSGYYFGVQYSLDRYLPNDNQLESYENSDDHHAFLNITYIENVNWLAGWDYRKAIFLPQDTSTGPKYTIPIDVYYGDYYQASTDHGIRVFTDRKSQPDFDDIRFTDDQGKTLLNYWLETTFEEDNTFHFTNSSVAYGHYLFNYPAAYYYNNRTYCGFVGELDQSRDPAYLNIHITYYDHENDTWGDVVYVSENVLGYTDTHGSPALFVDNDGYIHIFAGSHNDYFQHYVSEYPEDISSWVHILNGNYTGVWSTSDDGSPDMTYPHVFYDTINDVVHMTHREIITGTGVVMVYMNSTDHGYTWSDAQIIVNLNIGDGQPPNGTTIYYEQGELDPNNQELLHIVWSRYNGSRSGNYESIFYAYLNITSGRLYNASDYDLGTQISYDEDDYCLVFNSQFTAVQAEKVHVDANSNPYIVWGMVVPPPDNAKVMFRYWNDTLSAWSDIDNVSTYYRNSPPTDFIVHSSTNITAYFGAEDRDLVRYSWNGTMWTLEETIYTWDGVSPGWHQAFIPRGGYDDEFTLYITEWHISGSNFNFIKLFAWGSEGFLNGTVGKHARFWVELDGDLSRSNQIIYLYYGNPSVSSLSASLDVDDTVQVFWGSEENSFTSDENHLLGHHQVLGIDQDGSDYTITIYAAVAEGKNISIEFWDSNDNSWINSNINIDNDTLQWYNISLSSFTGIVGTSIRWRYVSDNIFSDSQKQILFIDYVAVEYNSKGDTTTTISSHEDDTISLLVGVLLEFNNDPVVPVLIVVTVINGSAIMIKKKKQKAKNAITIERFFAQT